MPIRPTPFVQRCSACGWEKLQAPASDALRPDEYYLKCPRCKHSKLTTRRATRLEIWRVQLFPWL